MGFLSSTAGNSDEDSEPICRAPIYHSGIVSEGVVPLRCSHYRRKREEKKNDAGKSRVHQVILAAKSNAGILVINEKKPPTPLVASTVLL
jgi:hypothetical protein